jgi:hypothetical protein
MGRHDHQCPPAGDACGVTDTDGSRPDCRGYLAAYGWERDDGEGIDEFR